MKVLVLDFDGVIADSQFECFLVGYNAYLKINPKTKLLDGKNITFESFSKIIKKFEKEIEEYKKLRPYVIDAFCWYVMFYMIENRIKVNNLAQYNKIRKRLIKNNYDKYIKFYYKERGKLQQKNFKKWLELEMPFSNIISAIKKLQKYYMVAIATNNRKKSINPFLRKYNIEPKIITDSLISNDKSKQILYIKKGFKKSFNQIYFIDDQVNYFPKLLKLGVNCYLATWGYNNKEQQKYVVKLGAKLMNDKNFYENLKSIA